MTDFSQAFNFAQHLFDLNQGRGDKNAYTDDQGTLSYAQLQEQARRLAHGLLAAGIHREERVLLVMHDMREWVISFLGAMYAGVVPVAVNTLLTAADYAYMLEHCRAQAIFTNGALVAVVQQALEQAQHEVNHIWVARPDEAPQGLPPAFEPLQPWLQQQTPLAHAARTMGDDPGFWLYSSGSTGKPKGAVHTHANPYWTAELYGKPVLGLNENDICFSAAKLYFAYGLGNALSFPLSVGANVAAVQPLRALEGISGNGVMLAGSGFIVTLEQAQALGSSALIRPYRNGRDLTSEPRGVLVIDAFGLSAEQMREHERLAVERGTSYRQLMENAGSACAKAAACPGAGVTLSATGSAAWRRSAARLPSATIRPLDRIRMRSAMTSRTSSAIVCSRRTWRRRISISASSTASSTISRTGVRT